MSTTPDHPTATPREPTMASSIEWLEQECARIDSTAAALRLEQELAAPSGSWWQALERNREPLETLAAHYRNAIAAMRAVEAMRGLLPEAAARCSEIEEMTRTSNPLASEYAHHTTIRLRKEAAAFPTPTESTDAK